MAGNNENLLFELVKQHGEQLKDLSEKVVDMVALYHAHAKEEEILLKKVISGFPDGNPDLHRMYHEALILREENKKKLLEVIAQKTLVGLIYAVLIGGASWLWTNRFRILEFLNTK